MDLSHRLRQRVGSRYLDKILGSSTPSAVVLSDRRQHVPAVGVGDSVDIGRAYEREKGTDLFFDRKKVTDLFSFCNRRYLLYGQC